LEPLHAMHQTAQLSCRAGLYHDCDMGLTPIVVLCFHKPPTLRVDYIIQLEIVQMRGNRQLPSCQVCTSITSVQVDFT
jgi:hypothetical protein